jgi:transcriptional regulator with GAF, ATPase, and Fis domain
MAKLIVKEGPSKVMEYELTDEVKVVGRDRTNDIRINHALVSRNHAQFFKYNNTYAVRDLESKNGTFVNNSPLTPGVAHPLKEGDQVRIGPTTFEFVAAGVAAPAGKSDGKDASDDSGPVPAAAVAAASAPAPAAAGGAAAQSAAPADPVSGTQVLEMGRSLFEPAKRGVPAEELLAGQNALCLVIEYARQLVTCTDTAAIHRALLGAVNDWLNPQRAFLFRMSENNSALLPAGQVLAPGENAGQPLQAARLAVAQAIRDKAGVIRASGMTAEQTGGAAETRVQMASPLLHDGALLGVIYLDAKEQARQYRLADLRLLSGLAQVTADFLSRDGARKGGGGFSAAALEQLRREGAVLGKTPVAAALRAYAAKAAASTAPLLLFGPPGAGKLHLARLVHLLSSRAAGPFVVVPGPALPKSTTEADLFGEEPEGGQPKPGRAEHAEGGTLYIDQLQEISLAAQERLFHLVSKSQVVRVGSETPRNADVRVIVGTNADPKDFVGHRLFHQPLIEELGKSMYELQPLSARREDIPELAEHFLERCRAKGNRKIAGFHDDALAALKRYPWPGNVEELGLAVHYAVFNGTAREILPSDLPPAVAQTVGAANGSGGGGGTASTGTRTRLSAINNPAASAAAAMASVPGPSGKADDSDDGDAAETLAG